MATAYKKLKTKLKRLETTINKINNEIRLVDWEAEKTYGSAELRSYLKRVVKLLSDTEEDLRFRTLREIILEKDWNKLDFDQIQRYEALINNVPLAEPLHPLNPHGTPTKEY